MCLIFFFFAHRPTHLHERKGDGKRNILLGWPNRDKIQPVLESFAAYCQLLNNVPFERHKFRSRMQEVGESYDHYRTDLTDQILRDKLVFGIQGWKVRERLLREKNLSRKKTDDIYRAHETMIQ